MKELNKIEATINKNDVALYAEVSGDQNPIHIDEEFAAKTQFRGLVAHGMLTLSYISEMLVGAFGVQWFETGKLKVRFKKPVYLGTKIHTEGRIVDIKSDSKHDLIDCLVALINSESGDELITGKASVKILKGNASNG